MNDKDFRLSIETKADIQDIKETLARIESKLDKKDTRFKAGSNHKPKK